MRRDFGQELFDKDPRRFDLDTDPQGKKCKLINNPISQSLNVLIS